MKKVMIDKEMKGQNVLYYKLNNVVQGKITYNKRKRESHSCIKPHLKLALKVSKDISEL